MAATATAPVPTPAAHRSRRTRLDHHPFCRRLRRRHATGRNTFHRRVRRHGQRHQHLARLSRRDSGPGRQPCRRVRLSGPLQQSRHPYSRRRAQHPRRHEPRRSQDEPEGPGAGRHPDRQLRRLHHRRSAKGRLQDQSSRGRLPQRLQGLSHSDQQAQPRRRVRGPPEHQGSRPLQELLRPRPGLLAV